MKNIIITIVIALFLFNLSCKEIQGPAGPAGPQGPPGTGLESLTDPTVMPVVLSTYPPANTEGPYNSNWEYYNRMENQIQVRFNKIMDRKSVIKGVKLFSPKTRARIDTTTFVWLSGNEFTVNIVDTIYSFYSSSTNHQWNLGEIYTLQVDSNAKDINGNVFAIPYSMTFKPEPFFRIKSVRPRNAEIISESRLIPYLSFNSFVDTSILSSIHLTPTMPGRWSLDYYIGDGSDSSLNVYFQSWDLTGFNDNTSYNIIVTSEAHDKYGNYLPVQFNSQFATAPFQVYYTRPQNGETKVPLFGYIRANLSSMIDTGSIRSSFKIIPNVEGSYYWYNPLQYFEFRADVGLIPDTTYTVTIDTSLRSMKNVNLLAPYTFSFKTIPFSASESSPVNNQTGVTRDLYRVKVYFTTNLDTSTIRNAFTMVGVSGRFYIYNGIREIYFYPDAPLKGNTVYTVTISTTLKTMNGYPLKVPYSFSFTTGN